MLYYTVTVKGKFSNVSADFQETSFNGRRLKKMSSETLARFHQFQHEKIMFSLVPNSDYFFCPCDTDGKTYIEFFVACCTRGRSFNDVSAAISGMINELIGIKVTVGEYSEITLEKYLKLFDKADDDGMYKRSEMISSCPFMHLRSTKLLRRDSFNWCDGIVEDGVLDHEKALAELGCIRLPGDELSDELERIYSPDAESGVFGHPVHYYIESPDLDSAKEVAGFIIRMLYSRGRLLSRCYSTVNMNSYDCAQDSENEFLDFLALQEYASSLLVFDNDQNGEQHGESDSAVCTVNEDLSRVFGLIEKASLTTLFFIVRITAGKSSGSDRALLTAVQQHLSLVRIKTGFGTKAQAVSYMTDLVSKSGYDRWIEDACRLLKDDPRSEFSVNMVNDIFGKWSRRVLTNTVYSCYENVNSPEKTERKRGSSAYRTLQNMTGLDKVKNIIDEIIAVSTVSKRKRTLGIEDKAKSCHMIFTGNPGTAKTTVARLLAQILREEKILKHGSFVECGRSDLVGKFVGWTAKNVVSMFNRAEGGILFIDEAYSLANDLDHGFGAEAIDTIVQEMENRRDRMIVILAGYSEPMKRLLDANSGLSSRIAFHIDFPDYGVGELEDIMSSMLRDNKLRISEDAVRKCRGIYQKAVPVDGFGNGRFVRNLIESAQLRQALRLRKQYGRRDIPKKALTELVADDFCLPESPHFETEHRFRIGFTA